MIQSAVLLVLALGHTALGGMVGVIDIDCEIGKPVTDTFDRVGIIPGCLGEEGVPMSLELGCDGANLAVALHENDTCSSMPPISGGTIPTTCFAIDTDFGIGTRCVNAENYMSIGLCFVDSGNPTVYEKVSSVGLAFPQDTCLPLLDFEMHMTEDEYMQIRPCDNSYEVYETIPMYTCAPIVEVDPTLSLPYVSAKKGSPEAVWLGIVLELGGEPLDPKCQPEIGTSKRSCSRKIRKCRKQGINMRWTGSGCKSVAGIRRWDAGCQCEEYCGFTCKKACNSRANRKFCQWKGSKQNGRCVNKVTKVDGEPMVCQPPVRDSRRYPKPSFKDRKELGKLLYEVVELLTPNPKK